MARVALLVTLVLAGAAADASAACERSTTWDAFVRCNLRNQKLELVRDLPAAKLVAFAEAYDPQRKRLELYVRKDGVWTRNAFSAQTNLNTELLGFEALADDTYRIELGYAGPQSVTFDQITTRTGLMRRRIVYVCSSTSSCRNVFASCELLVHGKAVGGYRGDAIWDGRTLKLRADMSRPTRYCSVPRGVLVEEPE